MRADRNSERMRAASTRSAVMWPRYMSPCGLSTGRKRGRRARDSEPGRNRRAVSSGAALFRADRIADEHVLDEIGADALIGDDEHERRDGEPAVLALRGL